MTVARRIIKTATHAWHSVPENDPAFDDALDEIGGWVNRQRRDDRGEDRIVIEAADYVNSCTTTRSRRQGAV